VRLFKNGGRNQAVRIPRAFELAGEEAIIRKEGDRLTLEPAPRKSLLALLETLETLEETFPENVDSPARERRRLMRYLLDTNIVSDLVRNPRV